MNGLVTVNYGSDRPTVSARELHEFLEVGTAFKDWFPRMCEYGFSESVDFNPLKIEQVRREGDREVKREITDYQLTVPMAKEISMLQRNERGKEARQYFIQIEKDWNSPEKVMARALEIAHNKLRNLEAKVEEDKPKVLFADAVATAKSSILIGDLAKLIRQNGHEIGQKRLFQWLRDNGFLMGRGESYNMPTQYSMERGLMEIKERTLNNPDGVAIVTKTPKVTGKGQQYFINKFLAKGD